MDDSRTPLLPDRMQQVDFFVCDIFDAVPKGDMASMEHPLFSVATQPDRNIRRYENGRNFIEITPSVKGIATVHDRDVLIYCISQIMAKINRKEPVHQRMRFKAYDMLKATNRRTDGRAYATLLDALERLRGTTVTTNIMTGEVEVTSGFGLIESFELVRKTRDGRMQEVEVKLSDWVFNAISANEVLTLHRDYFRLRKPLERRMYELARKHCGQQTEWRISLDHLRDKCGSTSPLKTFRMIVRRLIKEDERFGHMPDYAVSLDDEKDVVTFTNRARAEKAGALFPEVVLDPAAYNDARIVAPGWDPYMLEQEWRNWLHDCDMDPPRNAEKAFVGFCRRWAERRGSVL
ncbi:replication initiator protein A [Acuticoccus sediminis]|uniref:replication initiator protein A n=1 Tax=Acuticoccus sediminis TaxID=2184697 RepID=UPI001CFF1155|nr:replication initiator protein A [Acuticoccus sediminis]